MVMSFYKVRLWLSKIKTTKGITNANEFMLKIPMRSHRVPSAKAQVSPYIDTVTVSCQSLCQHQGQASLQQASPVKKAVLLNYAWISTPDLTRTVCLSWHTFIISKTSLGGKDDFSHKFLESWKNFGHVYLG